MHKFMLAEVVKSDFYISNIIFTKIQPTCNVRSIYIHHFILDSLLYYIAYPTFNVRSTLNVRSTQRKQS